eukprot:CAMPEP_0196654046 /NCGR_PEP_ID=MMETSP1086-20130531/3726_1 /TAXON_ID=77921 /ORGANISM="Cyanoptyche  gloeocystis , Strain SAG4.97" /LENGTH=123 /DNA_ID=CAMNT_0041985579 /DNA_START=698 /DNA_END=1069 /DNA_ORIENTATION=-
MTPRPNMESNGPCEQELKRITQLTENKVSASSTKKQIATIPEKTKAAAQAVSAQIARTIEVIAAYFLAKVIQSDTIPSPNAASWIEHISTIWKDSLIKVRCWGFSAKCRERALVRVYIPKARK